MKDGDRLIRKLNKETAFRQIWGAVILGWTENYWRDWIKGRVK